MLIFEGRCSSLRWRILMGPVDRHAIIHPRALPALLVTVAC